MAEKISQLDNASPLTGTEEVPIVQGGETVKTTTQDIADLGGVVGAVSSVNGDAGAVVVDLQSVLDEGPEAVLDALTVARFGIALNNDDQERKIEMDADGPSMKYINGADQLEVTVQPAGISIGGSVATINQSITIDASGIELNTPAIAAGDNSAKIAPTSFVQQEIAAKTVGVEDFPIMAAAWTPRVTGGCSALVQNEFATSIVNIPSLDFDQTTQEFAQVSFVLPRKYNNGPITAIVYWTAIAGSGDVQWGISGGAYSNDDALTVALGTPATVDDTLTATSDLCITSVTSAITLAGTPAAGDLIVLQISRNPASDTLSADAKFLGIVLRITTTTAIDE